MDLASTTEPCAVAPFSITALPSTNTGSATVAENPWPALLFLELTVSPMRMVIAVPSAMTIGLTGSFFAALVALPPLPAPPPAPGFSVADAGVPGLLEHPIAHSANSAAIDNTRIDFTSHPSVDTVGVPREL